MRQIYGTSRGRAQGIARADRALLSCAAAFDGGTVWADARDIRMADGAACASWTSRIGAPFLQATAAKKPLFRPSGFPDRGPCLQLDGVDDYLVSAEDMSGTDKVTALVSLHKLSIASVNEVIVEYGTYYNDLNASGWTLRMQMASESVLVGAGCRDVNYNSAAKTFEALGTKVVACVIDTAKAPDFQLEYDSSGVQKTLVRNPYPGAAGNFAAGSIAVGAGPVAGVYQRFWSGYIREVFIVPGIVPQNDLFRLSQHMRYKAGLS